MLLLRWPGYIHIALTWLYHDMTLPWHDYTMTWLYHDMTLPWHDYTMTWLYHDMTISWHDYTMTMITSPQALILTNTERCSLPLSDITRQVPSGLELSAAPSLRWQPRTLSTLLQNTSKKTPPCSRGRSGTDSWRRPSAPATIYLVSAALTGMLLYTLTTLLTLHSHAILLQILWNGFY